MTDIAKETVTFDIRWEIDQELPHLRRFAHALTGQADEADDLVQDTLERAWRKRDTRHPEGSLRAWLFRILYRVFLNGRRRQRRTPFSLTLEDARIPENALTGAAFQEARMRVHDMIGALARLPEEQRAAVILVALEDVSYEEAAHMLDVPVGTLRSRLFRGRERLRLLMEEKEEPERNRPRLRRVK